MRRELCLLVHYGLIFFQGWVGARSVEFGLTAEWPTWELSPLQEAAEFLAAEDDKGAPLFWEFVESFRGAVSSRVDRAVLGGDGVSSYNTSEHDAIWALTLEHSSHLVPQLSHALLQLYLAMRAYAPTLELHRSLRTGPSFDKAIRDTEISGCEASSVSWAVVVEEQDGEGDVLCSLQALQQRLQDLAESQEQTLSAEGSCTADKVGLPSSPSAAATYSFDHMYPSPSTSATTIVILYSVIGTSDCHRYHSLLSRYAAAGQIKYAFRHFTPPSEANGTRLSRSVPTALQGYGIFLDIKNMEYKNLDDSAPKAEDRGGEGGIDVTATTFPLEEEVAGLHFAKLVGRRPTLIGEFAKLRHNLKEEADTASGTNMKVWRMRDLGIQSTQTILAARDPLRKLLDLSQNFPSHATPLSSLRTKDDLRNAVIANLQSQVLGLGAQAAGSLFVNGVEFPVHNPNLNIFDLIKGIRDEVLLLQRVRLHMQLSPSALSTLLQLSSAPLDDGEEADLSNVRIDIYRGGKAAIHYFNNIEKDPQYARWPSSLQQLLFPSWQLQAIRRNLYTFTLVLDPLQPGATSALAMMQDMLEKHFPVRTAVLLLSAQQVEVARRDTSILDLPVTADQHPLYQDLGVSESNVREGDALLQGTDVVPRLFTLAKDKHGIQTAAAFLFLIGSGEVKSYKDVVDAYVEGVARKKGTSGWSTQRGTFSQEAWRAIKGGEGREGAHAMLKLVVHKNLPVPCFLLNGALTKGLEVEQNLMMLLGREQHLLARKVADGRLHDSSRSILGAILVGPSVFSRYHPLLDESFRSSMTRSVTLLGPQAQAWVVGGDFRSEQTHLEDIFKARLPFLHPPSSPDNSLQSVSMLLALDFCTPKGLTSLAAGLRFLLAPRDAKDKLRLAAVHSGPGSCQRSTIISALFQKAATWSGGSGNEAALTALLGLCHSLAAQPHEDVVTVAASLHNTHAWLKENQLQVLEASSDTYLGEALQSLLQVGAGEEAVLVNGRLVPLSNGVLQVDDLSLMVQVEGRTFTSSAIAAVIKDALPGNSTRQQSDVLLSAQSFLHTYASNPRVDLEGELARLPDRRLLLDLRPQSPAVAAAEANRDPLLDMVDIVAVLDPLSQAARRLGPLLMVIRDHLQIPLRVLLAPDPEILEFPLKSYYRFALFPSREATRVIFQSLPAKHILTTRVDVPEPWNVQTKWALQDLDNLQCDTTGNGHCGDAVDFQGRPNGPEHTTAELTLKNMLIYGQCFDAKLGNYAHGLQVVLWDAVNSTHRMSDTLVMQNLGYFQLQAQPGVWRLRLAPGRAEELYEIVQDQGAMLARVPEQELIVIKKDFNQVVDRVRVRKQAGKEHIPLLDDMVSEDGSSSASETEQEEASGVWSALSSVWGSTGAKAPSTTAQNETVHVFSLATGHLYERMLKIMMLSVTKRTSVPVKFWLLENFLSPAFKESALFMADALGFEVEFVTYKWPNWLRQQTEKQRIIWGYKILFLDVLFPLHVKKVIYVDADQVLRADLKELWDMDLKGKPYAYTPFCTSREETLGFQFWRQGYWKNHLQGRPYHISALYVVDLARFRRMGVGDRLRAIYDQLSRDPNSLSNLDQDLPNYAQHMVPIHSLPQEWLWCESWCSDESKADAKTIDLCNNPRYKENKLDMARRVVSGGLFNESWVELDEEVRAIEKQWRHVSVAETEA